MPKPVESRSVTDRVSSPSARSDADETQPVAGLVGAPTDTRFGPPAARGEVGTLGPYRIVKLLGRGGMGVVYAALDTRLERRIALKVMLPKFAADRADRDRFLREARAVARIKHDNVVAVYEADERNGVPYFAMEFLAGYPLNEYLQKKGTPTVPQVLRIAVETAAGLAAVHKIGLVHRDIKPANLWLEAPHGRVKVLDFGLVRLVDADVELTQNGALLGTPSYMSPEQGRGERVDHRADLFSLGAVMYRLCTGQPPFFGASTMAVLTALATEEPTPVRELNPAVPEPLAALIHQLLAKRADARPRSADEVLKRLRAIAQNRPVSPARGMEQPQSELPVVYVSLPVTAVSDANPFADIDMTETEIVSPQTVAPSAAPARKRADGRWLWAAAGFAALLALASGITIIIKNKDGTETKIEVPDGSTVTVKDKGGKTLAKVGPEPKPKPAVATDPERRAAESVMSLGGIVRIDGMDRDLRAVADLPRERFTLTTASFEDSKRVTEEGLAHFKDCKELAVLNLGYTNVTDAGLAHFKDCKRLYKLVLWRTEISDAGLAHFKDCTEVRELLLDGVKLTDDGLAHFKGCKSLEVLSIPATGVTDAGLAQLKGHKALRVLIAPDTPVTDAGLEHLKKLKELRELHLGGTRVTDAGLEHLRKLEALTHLGLGGTAVTDAGLVHVTELDQLQQLNLGGTRVTDAGLDHVKENKGLTFLWLNDTKVTDAGVKSLKGLKNLYHLNLRNTPVTDAGLAHLTGLKELRELFLEGTPVTDAGLATLTELKGLHHLMLIDTAVTDAGLAHLKGLKELKTLRLQGTKVTAKGVADFQAAVPECKVEHTADVAEK
jgi:serine/threonine protein kinase/Leucine-rich repeat (LRR) protein